MFDGIFAAYGQSKRLVFDDKYDPSQAITNAELIEMPQATRLIIVFSPWHTPKKRFRNMIAKKLATTGASVLIYNFNQQILSNDLIQVKNSFEYIAMSIAEDARVLSKAKGYASVDLFGISLGNIALCLTADVMDSFDAVTMLVPGSELAAPLWQGWRTKKLRNALARQHLRLVDLQKEWDMLAPESHAEVFKNHQVHIILGRHDRFIPYEYGEKLAETLKAADKKVSVITTPYGHIETILSYHYMK